MEVEKENITSFIYTKKWINKKNGRIFRNHDLPCKISSSTTKWIPRSKKYLPLEITHLGNKSWRTEITIVCINVCGTIMDIFFNNIDNLSAKKQLLKLYQNE